MLGRLVLWMALSLAAAWPASAEVLRFVGSFETLYDCPDTYPGSACGSPPPVAISLPFTFTIELTQIIEHRMSESSTWMAPEFPLPPPITQATFEALSGRTVRTLTGVNTYQNGPVFLNLLSYAGHGHAWSGTDAQGRVHNYNQSINVGFEGAEPRQAPGTPITFEELTALWDSYRNTGRNVDVHADVVYSITNPDGSFKVAGHIVTGHFRLCRAPGALAVAAAAVVSRVRGG